MHIKTPYALYLAAAMLAATICSCTPTAIAPTHPARTMSPSFNAVWDASVSVLWEYRFTLDRQDRRAGVMTTLPLTSRYGFEFWRDDEVTLEDQLEGLTQTMYRQVIITIAPVAKEPATTQPAEGPASQPAERSYTAQVQVRLFRSDRPTSDVQSTADAYRMFTRPRSVTMSDTEIRPGKEWIVDDLGRDQGLERVISQKIAAKAAVVPPAAK
jgi:hypothetical protein